MTPASAPPNPCETKPASVFEVPDDARPHDHPARVLWQVFDKHRQLQLGVLDEAAQLPPAQQARMRFLISEELGIMKGRAAEILWTTSPRYI